MKADNWADPMPEETARRVVGSKHFDWCMAQGAGFCAVYASAAWAANEPEKYAAYKCAERLVNEQQRPMVKA